MHSAAIADRLKLLIVGRDSDERLLREFFQGIDYLPGNRIVELAALVYQYSVIAAECGWRCVLHEALVFAVYPHAGMDSINAYIV